MPRGSVENSDCADEFLILLCVSTNCNARRLLVRFCLEGRRAFIGHRKLKPLRGQAFAALADLFGKAVAIRHTLHCNPTR